VAVAATISGCWLMLLMAEILKYTVLVLPRIEQLSTRLGQNLL